MTLVQKIFTAHRNDAENATGGATGHAFLLDGRSVFDDKPKQRQLSLI